MTTVAESSPVAGFPSLSRADAATVFTWSASPKAPDTNPSNEQVNVPPAGMAVDAVEHVLFATNGLAGSSTSPNTSSVQRGQRQRLGCRGVHGNIERDDLAGLGHGTHRWCLGHRDVRQRVVERPQFAVLSAVTVFASSSESAAVTVFS